VNIPFFHGSYAWNPKQPFLNGCFNWMIPNLDIENGWKSPFPSIYKWLAMGVPGEILKIPSRELTYPLPYGTFGSMIFLSPRWDMLIPWTVSGFIPSYTHLQPWLDRVSWGYNYLITRGAPSCLMTLFCMEFLTCRIQISWFRRLVGLEVRSKGTGLS